MSYGNGIDAPIGFQPAQYLNGSPWDGKTSNYALQSGYATSIFKGDPVTVSNTGYINSGLNGQGAVIGIFWGVRYTDSLGNLQFSPVWQANTTTLNSANAEAVIIDDKDVLFDVSLDNSLGVGNKVWLLQSDIGRNANCVIAAGNVGSGNSATYLDINTLASTATLTFKILRFTPTPLQSNYPGYATQGGQAATGNYPNVLVAINNHLLKGGTGTQGTH